MKALKENGFRVPVPMAHSRHTVVMELVDAFPLRQITRVPDPAGLYAELIGIALRLAQFGLIHGDFNEFNILIREDQTDGTPDERPHEEDPPTSDNKDSNSPGLSQSSLKITPVIIDFPQMVSIDHNNAEMYFDRDINCIKRFFERKYAFVSAEPGPFFADARELAGESSGKRLDVEVEASGFSKKMAKDLEKYMQAVGVDGGNLDREDRDRDDYGDDRSDSDGSPSPGDPTDDTLLRQDAGPTNTETIGSKEDT